MTAAPDESSSSSQWQHAAVSAVLDAFESGDLDAVLALCAEDVTFAFPFIGEAELSRDEFVGVIGRTTRFMQKLRFSDLRVEPLQNENRVVAHYRGRATITRTGRDYHQKYFSVFQFDDRRRLEYFEENFDSAQFKIALGLAPDWMMT